MSSVPHTEQLLRAMQVRLTTILQPPITFYSLNTNQKLVSNKKRDIKQSLNAIWIAAF